MNPEEWYQSAIQPGYQRVNEIKRMEMNHYAPKSPYQQFQSEYPAIDQYARDVVSGRRFTKTINDTGTMMANMMNSEGEFNEALGMFGIGGMTKINNLYHGTDKVLTKIKPSKEGLIGPGVYTTSDAKQAAKYGKNVYKTTVTTNKPIDKTKLSKVDAESISKSLNGWLVDDYKTSYDNWLNIKREFGAEKASKVFQDAGFDALFHKKYVIPFSGSQVEIIK